MDFVIKTRDTLYIILIRLPLIIYDLTRYLPKEYCHQPQLPVGKTLAHQSINTQYLLLKTTTNQFGKQTKKNETAKHSHTRPQK